VSENNSNGSSPQGPDATTAAQPEGDAPAGATASERAEGSAPTSIERLKAELEESQARARLTQQRLTDEHDRLLRTAAEFENYKKRVGKEKDDARKFGTESLLKDFLPVADNLDRAMEAASTTDPKQILEGVRLVQKLIESTLARHGVVGFSALGLPFDPAVHEALMQLESDKPPGTVVQEMAKGYKLHDRLVRPAAVVVAKSKPGAEADSASRNGDQEKQGGGGAL